MDELPVLNNLCKDLYESVDPQVRHRAEMNLAELSESPECLQRCMLLLARGDYPYGPMVASTTLMKLLGGKTSITSTQKLELAKYLLEMLGQGAPQFPSYLVTSLCQLFARLTKQEWTYQSPEAPNQAEDAKVEYPFRDPVDSLVKTINMDNLEESMLAVQLLTMLVSDMNSAAGMESVNKHRKNLSQFRDDFLYEIFSVSLTFLSDNVDRNLNDRQIALLHAVLNLNLQCLLFDYIGSLTDETSEDNCNVQIPTAWRASFTDGKIVQLMFKLLTKLPQESSEKVMTIIAQLASIRRTLFNGTERQAYVQKLVEGVVSVIMNPEKLSDQAAFHEFCRLIARLKTNYQLCELIAVPCYSHMLRLLAEFTVQSLRMMEFSANSTYFLMTFWQRMVTSVPYVRNNDEHLLNVYCPEIMTAFIESRLQHVENVIREGAENPLDDQGSTLQIMEHLAIICRCEYEKTCKLLTQHFDQNANIWMNGSENDINTAIAEGRLVWLITLIGTAVFGKTTSTSSDSHDKMDGEMIARCITVMRFNDNRLQLSNTTIPLKGNLRLEVSFIHMLEQFRRAYIMDQITRASSVYDTLEAELRIAEESDMLGVIVQKILTNLKFWPSNSELLDLSLSLLKDLSLGYSAVRKLFRLPEVQLLLNNHTADHFIFLGPTIDYQTMKQRTTFYEALTRLLTTDYADDEEMLQRFLRPLTDTVEGICTVIQNNCQRIEEEQLKKIITGLCRDLRGVAIASTTKAIFQILFEWMYPEVFNIMQFSVEKWPGCADVITPILRLLSEMVQNRQQRLKFEMSSCSAVLLFKETSKIVSIYGDRLLQLPEVSKDRVYKERYKNIGVIFLILKNALIGAYVPFGVFRLYGDSCLQDALTTFIKLFMSIPQDDFHSYTKIAQNHYNLLEHVVQDNMPFVTNLSVDVFCSLLRSIHSGLSSVDAIVITSACSSLDTILNYLYRRLTRSTPPTNKVGMDPEGDNILNAIKQHPDILAKMLQAVITLMMFGEVKCQWSLSRPLLGLILIQEDVYSNMKRELTSQQTYDRQADFDQLFTQLMSNVEMNLTVKNKDTFTQNLTRFRRDIALVLKGQSLPANSVSQEMQ
ncbi:hypothetical protein B9Z55_019436 [Caenorhabditis nigoni]|uniref:Exportin-7/Ran-binding protein 17 TPR repeats domain-containing protein n=1 Tax=Caenorhabditis nigoni TaxID=1611254 RepID=A0A2G5TJ80_9PELO|nr:hypothetical protein B9Z55_019436 [Caenorhabditis nigoni]